MKKIISSTLSILTKTERKKLAFLSVANLCSSIIDIASLAGLLAVVDLYTNPNSISGIICKRLSWNKDSLIPAFTLLVFFMIKNAIGFWLLQKQTKFGYSIATRISGNQLPAYLSGNFSDYVSTENSVLNRKIQHQPIEFAHYVLSGLQQISTEIALATLATIAILTYNASLFFLLMVFLIPPLVIAAFYSKVKLRKARENVKKDAEKSDQYLNEALASFVEANIYDKINFFTRRYILFQKKLNDHLSGLQTIQALPNRLIETFAVTGLFMLIWFQHLDGTSANLISIGAFMAAAYKIIPSIVRIANLSSMVRTYAYTTIGLNNREIQDKKNNLISIKTIKFENISFYRGDKTILNKINFEIRSGDFAWIKGFSGIGKTTLINILLGFLPEKNGSVCFNNENVNQQERTAAMNCISYVKQQNFLINDTIVRNITLEEVPSNETMLHQAIAFSELRSFIESEPDGLQKKITDSGKNISGGQRQRIAIARAIYKNASLIILDEPFNELDEDSEKKLLQNFKQLSEKGCIILLISHSDLCQPFCNKQILLNV